MGSVMLAILLMQVQIDLLSLLGLTQGDIQQPKIPCSSRGASTV